MLRGVVVDGVVGVEGNAYLCGGIGRALMLFCAIQDIA